MGLFRPSRARRGPDPFYRWKVAIFTVGAAVAFVGMFGHHDQLVLVAVPILAVGVAVRWLPRSGGGASASGAEEPEDAEPVSDEPPPASGAPHAGGEPP